MTTPTRQDIAKWAKQSGHRLGPAMEHELTKFVELARADLVAENERLSRSNSSYANLTKAQEGQLTALRQRLYELKDADKSLDSERAANTTLTEELTATHTALAAAEARETKLREALKEIQTTDWVSDKVRRIAKSASTKPHDDSALREMIAGVYGECAKGCRKEAVVIVVDGPEERAYNNAISDCELAIRALAEKAKGEVCPA